MLSETEVCSEEDGAFETCSFVVLFIKLHWAGHWVLGIEEGGSGLSGSDRQVNRKPEGATHFPDVSIQKAANKGSVWPCESAF